MSTTEVGIWGSNGAAAGGFRRHLGFGMSQTVQKSTILVLTLWVAASFSGSAVVSGAAEGQDGPALQPQGLNWAGIYALREFDPGLTGAGVRFGVVCRSYTHNGDGEPQNDYRPNVTHGCFQNARLRFCDDGSVEARVSPHSTAICSMLFGEDPVGTASYLDPFSYQGAVPAAEGRVYEFVHFLTEYVFTQNVPAVDVVAVSFGQPFEAWWTRGIEALVEHEGLVVVASIGNGSDASDPPFYPGAGSNTIGVGVVSSVNTENPATNLSHFALAYPQQSSLGPTDDGRCKPDLIAPGNCLAAVTDGDQGYAMSGNGSSFSTPVTAGVVGLLVQAAKRDSRLGSVLLAGGGNCVFKAILMTSATKLPYWHKGRLSGEDDHEAPLDYVQGAGMVNAVRAYQLLTAGPVKPGGVVAAGWDLNQLEVNQTLQQVYRIAVDEPANKVLTATLAWNRHYRKEYPFERLPDSDSDLRLELWAVDPVNSNNDLLLDYSDSRADNVEHIQIETLPEYTLYEIVVSYSDLDVRITSAVSEGYGVAWNVDEKLVDESIFWHDLNADGIVNDLDLAVLMDNLIVGLKSPDAYVIGDVNTDGSIDVSDMQALRAHRNRTADWHPGGTAN